jgi:hypothetical protein
MGCAVAAPSASHEELSPKANQLLSRLQESAWLPDKYTFSALFNAAYHCKMEDGTLLLEVTHEWSLIDTSVCGFLRMHCFNHCQGVQ